MQAYGQREAIGLKGSAAVNDGKRHLCGLDAACCQKLGNSQAVASKHKTRAAQRGIARAVAKRELRAELMA